MNSMRNLFIVGVALFLGLSVPEYFRGFTFKALPRSCSYQCRMGELPFFNPQSLFTNIWWKIMIYHVKRRTIGQSRYSVMSHIQGDHWLSVSLMCSSTIFWIPSSPHLRLWPCLLLFSWITHLSTRTVQETEECHGGSNFGNSKGTAATRSFTLSLSTSTDSSLHLEVAL